MLTYDSLTPEAPSLYLFYALVWSLVPPCLPTNRSVLGHHDPSPLRLPFFTKASLGNHVFRVRPCYILMLRYSNGVYVLVLIIWGSLGGCLA